MLQVTTPDLTTWDALLPEPARQLPDELARIDAFLDDERFIAPWRALFDARLGRPSIPVPTLIRLLYLKHRYQLGYETLCWEVSDSIAWRRFTRIPLDRPVPHPTTLVKLVRRAGPDTIGRLNMALLTRLAEGKLLRGRKLRIDTTVVEADIDYPTDADLLGHAIGKLGGLVRRIRARGVARRIRFRDRHRAAGRRLRQLSQVLRRRGVAMDQIDRLTAQLAWLARATLRDVDAIRRTTRRRIARRPCDGWLRRLAADLDQTIHDTQRLLAQTTLRLAGQRTIGDRMVSLADPDARPIRKGKPRSPTEFGYKLLVAEDEGGFIADHHLEQGNPPDAAQLLPAIARVMTVTGRIPDTVAADRGFGTATNSRAITTLGVRRDGLQRTGRPSTARATYEHTRAFRRQRNWRVGIEARISHLKRGFGLRRTRLRHLAGARTWAGLGIFAYNLHRMTVITAAA